MLLSFTEHGATTYKDLLREVEIFLKASSENNARLILALNPIAPFYSLTALERIHICLRSDIQLSNEGLDVFSLSLLQRPCIRIQTEHHLGIGYKPFLEEFLFPLIKTHLFGKVHFCQLRRSCPMLDRARRCAQRAKVGLYKNVYI